MLNHLLLGIIIIQVCINLSFAGSAFGTYEVQRPICKGLDLYACGNTTHCEWGYRAESTGIGGDGVDLFAECKTVVYNFMVPCVVFFSLFVIVQPVKWILVIRLQKSRRVNPDWDRAWAANIQRPYLIMDAAFSFIPWFVMPIVALSARADYGVHISVSILSIMTAIATLVLSWLTPHIVRGKEL